jgi:hypothetical protein
VVALPDAAAARRRGSTKASRQLDAFRDSARVGDAVLLAAGDRLLLGEIAGAYRHERRRVHPHVRPVRWLGELPPSALRRPARLQDPRLFFALRDEDDLRALCDRAADRHR